MAIAESKLFKNSEHQKWHIARPSVEWSFCGRLQVKNNSDVWWVNKTNVNPRAVCKSCSRIAWQ